MTASERRSSTPSNDPVDQLRAVAYANAMTHLAVPELARVCHQEYGNLSAEQCAVIDVLRADLGSLLRDVVARGISVRSLRAPLSRPWRCTP